MRRVWGLTPEQLEIQELARDFAESEIRPSVAEWDEARALDDGVLGKLGELGFMGMMVPRGSWGASAWTW